MTIAVAMSGYSAGCGGSVRHVLIPRCCYRWSTVIRRRLRTVSLDGRPERSPSTWAILSGAVPHPYLLRGGGPHGPLSVWKLESLDYSTHGPRRRRGRRLWVH